MIGKGATITIVLNKIRIEIKEGESVVQQERMTGEQRREYIIKKLQKSTRPITGTALADETGVSRQVIVTDMALLKTSNEPIIATNRGYLYLDNQTDNALHRKVVICQHPPELAKEELEIIVDCGVTVVDVIVEHPFYGEMTGSLMVQSRFDVEQFLTAISQQEATLLSELTDGIHLHTIEADSEEKINRACEKLQDAGILYTVETK